MFERTRIKFGEVVAHDQPFLDPLSGKTIARDFYDRREISATAYQQLQSGATKTLILLGGRRAGKTSQIRHLRSCFLARQAGCVGFIEIPWGGIRTRDELAREILQALRAYMGRDLALQETLTQRPLVEPQSLAGFLETMHTLLALAGDRPLILAIDEFDSILVESALAAGDADEGKATMELVNALVGGAFPNLRLLLSMAAIPAVLSDRRSSSLLANATLATLHCFPKPDMDEMVLDIVQQEQQVGATDLEEIYRLSGGWPYYAKLLLACMADLPAGPEQVAQALQAAVCHHGASQTITNIYDLHFDAHQKRLVLLLALHDGRINAAELAESGAAMQTAARQLADRDFVAIDANGDCYFRIGLLTHWFRRWSRFELEVERRMGE
jgi:hypothetical protein